MLLSPSPSLPASALRNLGKRLLGRRLAEWLSRYIVTRSMTAAIGILKRPGMTFTADSVIALLFSRAFKYVRPWQHRQELLALAKALERKRPLTMLEIGTASGGTLLLAACLADARATIFSIDLPCGPYGGGYPEWKTSLYQSFARAGQRIELIRGDSHSEAVFDTLRQRLEGRTIDYLFIDADHSYEGVRRDFEMYAALLSDGAMVAFHDIAVDRDRAQSHQVSIYWNEIKVRYPHMEFIADADQDKFGIGVLTYRRVDVIPDRHGAG
jgi:cephalosporin hydroxylase